MRKLPCRVSGVVSSASTHARTHAPARTHAHTRARAHTHASTRAPSVPLPNQAAEGTRAGRTAALGFDPRAAHICARTGLTPTHICTRSQRCHYCASAPGQPLPTSAPGLRSATAHIFTGTGLTHCPHLRRDLAQPLPTSAPGLRSATAHICAGTALAHCPHRHRAHNLPTSRLPRKRKCVRPMVRAVPVCLCEANAVCICSFYADSPCCSVA